MLNPSAMRLYIMPVNVSLSTFFLFPQMSLDIMTSNCYGCHGSIQNSEVNKV